MTEGMLSRGATPQSPAELSSERRSAPGEYPTFDDADRRPRAASLRSLDLLNFFKADVPSTVGPYLAIYLQASRHWDLAQIGIAMSVQGFATVLAQTPAGALVDALRQKRALVALSSVVIAAACVTFVRDERLGAVIAAQSAVGVALVVIPPAVAALSLGLVGHRAFAERMGRNESLSHLGAVAAAVCVGLLTRLLGRDAIFYFAAAVSLVTGTAAVAIREADINHAVAREAPGGGAAGARAASLEALVADRRIRVFAAAVVLFHFGNAAMLPLVGERLAARNPPNAALYMSACIIIAQVVMTPVATLAGRSAASWGRKPVLLIGFLALPVRGVLFTLSANPYYLLSVQILDGVGAGIFGVLWVIVVADLARGTGRFNLLQGAINTGVASGAALSNLMAGFVARRAGYDAAFLLLAAIATVALLVLWVAVPETDAPAADEEGASARA